MSYGTLFPFLYMLQVALGVPSLWSKPVLHVLRIPHQYIPDILIRSRSATLSLLFFWDGDASDIVHDPGLRAWLCPAILRRARCLQVAGQTELITSVAAHLPSHERMTQLRTLDISRRISWGSGHLPDLPEPFQNLAEVTSLSLYDLAVPWGSPILSSKLVQLRLLDSVGLNRPSYDEFRDFLATLHMLEVLQLRDVVPNIGPLSVQKPAIVLAPTLIHLTIAVTDEEIALDGLAFISLVQAPSHCIREYEVDELRDAVDDLVVVDEIMGRFVPVLSFTRHDNIKPRHLLLTQRGMDLLSMTTPPQSASPQEQTRELDSGAITTKLTMHSFTQRAMTFHLANYLPFVALDNLHTISLDMSSVRVIDANGLWVHLLQAEGVRCVGLVQTSASYDLFIKLLEALTEPRALSSGEGTRIIFPRLEVLALPLNKDESAHSEFIIALIDLLHARQESGTPFRELIISKKAGNWDIWRTIRAMVKVTFIDYPLRISPVMPQLNI